MAQAKPNIIFFFCDDLGWGDVSCLNADSQIATPKIDSLAASGISFSDAHAGSAVCTPSRYTLLTGRYCWRTPLKADVHSGYSPALITPDRPTVASRLKDHGYATACYGKWHMGMDWALKGGGTTRAFRRRLNDEPADADHQIDFAKPIQNAPSDVGFDHFYGISASLDMSPYVFIENNGPTTKPTSYSPEGHGDRLSRPGIAAQGWRHEDVLPTVQQKALDFIDARAKDGKPFFLYIPVNGPHTPIVPTEEWVGTSNCGLYGDFVQQIDAMVGSLLERLDLHDLRNNTAFFFSSDNGPETHTAEYRDRYNHMSTWRFRGMKRDNWEGGHRIPYVVSWPARVGAGVTCDRFVELADFYTTAIAIAGAATPAAPNAGGEDSFNMLPLLLGTDASDYRSFAVHHSFLGKWAIRRGKWKLLLHSGSGGNFYVCPENDDPVQLYNLDVDPFETTNVYKDHKALVADLKRQCLDVIQKGRSTPGPAMPNDGPDQTGESATHWQQLEELLSVAVD